MHVLISKDASIPLSLFKQCIEHMNFNGQWLKLMFEQPNWSLLFDTFKSQIFNLTEDERTDILKVIKRKMYQTDNVGPFLGAISAFRFNKQQLKDISENSFSNVVEYDKKVDEYFSKYKQGSIVDFFTNALLAIGSTTISILTFGFFDKTIISTREYNPQKEICEHLYREAKERDMDIFTYNPIKTDILMLNIQVFKEVIHELDIFLREVQHWWQTAMRTPLTIEQGLAVLINQSFGFFEGIGASVGGGIDWLFGTASDGTSIDTNELKKHVEELNKMVKPLKNKIQIYANIAVECHFQMSYLKVNYDICKKYYDLEPMELDAGSIHKIASDFTDYSKILEHLIDLAETKLKISKVRETIEHAETKELLEKIQDISDKLGGLPPKKQGGASRPAAPRPASGGGAAPSVRPVVSSRPMENEIKTMLVTPMKGLARKLGVPRYWSFRVGTKDDLAVLILNFTDEQIIAAGGPSA
jgi:hypothetical protein